VGWDAEPCHLLGFEISGVELHQFRRVELERQGTDVVGVHVGFVDTDLTAMLEVEKVPPQTVATSALDALEQGQPEAIVDDFSRAVKANLSDDQNLIYPGVKAQFIATVVA